MARKRIRAVSEDAKGKEWDSVISKGEAIRDLYPDYVETGSVYEFLANAWLAKGDKAKEAEEAAKDGAPANAGPDGAKPASKTWAMCGCSIIANA